jgi:hypothetical protein
MTDSTIAPRSATSELGKCRLVVGVALDQRGSEKFLGSQKRGESVANLAVIESEPLHLFVHEKIARFW